MNANSVVVPANSMGKVLSALCVATFWLLPFSPFVAIAAVKATDGTAGWPRRLARAGALLCTAYTLLLAGATLWIAYVLIWNRAMV